MKPQKSLRARAMDILSRQEVSRLGLKRKLAPHAESEEELENVLNEFAERNWQSDLRYAEAYIRSKSRKHGSLRLKQALAQQGIDEETSRNLLPNRSSEKQAAIAVLRKKFKQPAADLKENKTGAFPRLSRIRCRYRSDGIETRLGRKLGRRLLTFLLESFCTAA
ncbi:regulatory protein RecX [Neisseria lactamica ATCC 23970]|uniref:Regulatory protein RecX n=1 Tax=Neisseria lactamica ATCC 23970 TaxID=546265 RepID=D0WBV4_NEILA|nr:regulatory protein RecX [Neisseria lactamica ATCC 23970]